MPYGIKWILSRLKNTDIKYKWFDILFVHGVSRFLDSLVAVATSFLYAMLNKDSNYFVHLLYYIS